MVQKPVSKTLEIVVPGYRMHSQSFRNVLDGISEEDALIRLEGKTNHCIWIVGNLVNCRYWMADLLGIDKKDPNGALFNEGRALDPALPYPTLEALRQEWHTISGPVYEHLLTVTDEALQQAVPFGMGIPFLEENKLNMMGMCIDRESYLLGQLGLMRRALNYPAASYHFDPSLPY